MTNEQLLKNLSVPTKKVDAILDTDTYNEIDDQFALTYFMRCEEKINPVAIYAAPFAHAHMPDPAQNMLRSYDEIFKVLQLGDHTYMNDKVFKGSDSFLVDEKTPVLSDAARDLAKRAMNYSPDEPLYVVAIGAITNIASALLLNPEIKENIVIVWLGGHAFHWPHTKEYNMVHDIAAARIVFASGAPLVLLPCNGVVSAFDFSKNDIEAALLGKNNKLADYLATNTVAYHERVKDRFWFKAIWDVTAVAWLVNDNDKFLLSTLEHTPVPEYDSLYAFDNRSQFLRYIYHINKTNLFEDLCAKILR